MTASDPGPWGGEVTKHDGGRVGKEPWQSRVARGQETK